MISTVTEEVPRDYDMFPEVDCESVDEFLNRLDELDFWHHFEWGGGVDNCMMEIMYEYSPHPAKYYKMTNKLTKEHWIKHPMRGVTFGKGVQRQLLQRQRRENRRVDKNFYKALEETPYNAVLFPWEN